MSKQLIRKLAVDEHWVERMSGVWRTLNHPTKHPDNPILKADRSWEGYLAMQPGTVIYDEEDRIFKMWYNALPSAEKPDVDNYLCYAVSEDGSTWEKPELGNHEHNGSTANNIVLRGVDWTHSVIKDDEAGPRRYKLAYWSRKGNLEGVYVAFSADGVHWVDHGQRPVVPGWASGDTFSVMRDPNSGSYFLYHKTPGQSIRTVSRAISEDFVEWQESRLVLAPDIHDAPDTQFYGMSAFPYAGLCLGLIWVYHTYPQTVDMQLVYSDDGLNWHRACERKLFLHLVPTNRYSGKSFDSMMVYPASSPVEKDGLLWFYYSGFSVPHNALPEAHDGQIGVACVPRDAFCRLDATGEGVVVSRPFTVRGSKLIVNGGVRGPDEADETLPAWSGLFDGCPSGCGSIVAEVQDENENPISGYLAEDCRAFMGSGSDTEIHWKEGSDLSSMEGRQVRLKFLIRNASLYSWCVQA